MTQDSSVSARRHAFLLAALVLYGVALPLSMAATNAVLALLLVVALPLPPRKLFLSALPVSLGYLSLFFLWAAATDGLHAESLRSFAKFWNLFPYFLIPLGFGAVAKDAELEAGLKAAVVAACVVAVLGALEYGLGWHYFFEGRFGAGNLVENNRFFGFQSYPLHSAALYMILMLAAMSLALFRRTAPAQRAFWWSAALLLGLGLLLTVSRSYYLALVPGAGLLLARRGWKAFLIGAVCGIIFLFILNFSNSYIKQRIKSIEPQYMDEAARQRTFIWCCALGMIRDHPAAGVGYGKWRTNLDAYAARFPDWGFRDPAAYGHAHDSYLTVGAETGLIGLGLFLAFWAALLKEQWETLKSCRAGSLAYALGWASLASILALLAAAFFEHNLMTATVWLSLFFLLGLFAAAARSEEAA